MAGKRGQWSRGTTRGQSGDPNQAKDRPNQFSADRQRIHAVCFHQE